MCEHASGASTQVMGNTYGMMDTSQKSKGIWKEICGGRQGSPDRVDGDEKYGG